MNVLEIIGWIGSLAVVVSLLQSDMRRLRAINLTGCLIGTAYNSAIGVWPSVGLNAALAVINLGFILRGTSAGLRTRQVRQDRPDAATRIHVEQESRHA